MNNNEVWPHLVCLVLPIGIPGSVRVLVLLRTVSSKLVLVLMVLSHPLQEVRPTSPQRPGRLAQLTDPWRGTGVHIPFYKVHKYWAVQRNMNVFSMYSLISI